MGKSLNWSLEDLQRKNRTATGDIVEVKKIAAKKPKFEPIYQGLGTDIRIPFLLAGLNGDDGLIRAHWSETAKMKKKLCAIIKQQTQNKHLGYVKIKFTRYAHKLMDWDNHCASFKHLGDSLKDCGVIVDDNPKIVITFTPMQFQVKMNADEFMEVSITDYSLNEK